MKFVAAVLVTLVAVAYGQGIALVDFGAGNMGYDNDCINVIKDNGDCKGTFAIPTAMQPNITGNQRAWAVVAIQARNVNSASAKAHMMIRRGTTASATHQSAEIISRPGGAVTDVDAMYYGSYDVSPQNGTWNDGFAINLWIESCSGCRESADWKVTAFLAVGTSSACNPVAGLSATSFGHGAAACELLPFPIKQDSYSWDQVVMQGSYGTPAYYTSATSFYLYIAVDTDSSNAVTLLYEAAKPMFPATTGWPQDNDGAMARILPLGTTARRSGKWRTGGMNLPAGTWHVSPYMATAGSSGGRFDFAFGVNHEPSSAGIAVPSLLIAAILAIAALFM
jgi:hypothetical protein